MFPIRDSTPRAHFPYVNYLIILLNIFFFIFQITSPDFDIFVYQYGFIAAQFNILHPADYTYLFTSLFLHGGFLHIISNVWFLHIFGDNIEDKIGHVLYLVFYLCGGLVATLVQYFVSPMSGIPMIGASGAISAVAGAYVILFYRSTVLTFIPFIFFTLIEVPVWFFLGYWFFIQLFSGLGSLVTFDLSRGGVAWFAHVGGFIFGTIVAITLRRTTDLMRKDAVTNST